MYYIKYNQYSFMTRTEEEFKRVLFGIFDCCQKHGAQIEKVREGKYYSIIDGNSVPIEYCHV